MTTLKIAVTAPTDAERHDENGGGRETRSLAEETRAVSDVADALAEERARAVVATSIADALHAAQRQSSVSTGVRGTQATSLVLRRLRLEVKPEFLVQIGVESTGTDPRQDEQLDSIEPAHRALLTFPATRCEAVASPRRPAVATPPPLFRAGDAPGRSDDRSGRADCSQKPPNRQ